MPIPNQPIPPAEGVYNEIEQLIDVEQPSGLWPHNQNSNFGMVRKAIADHIQSAVDTLSDLYDESFVDTAEGYLGRWERELGLPRGTAYSTLHRRTLVHSRRSISPFTRSRRQAIVERFMLDTLGGEATAFSASGIPLTVGGVNLFSGAQTLAGLYRIYEDIPNFSYEVWIKNTVTPDVAGLLRELSHITPAGISFVIDNSKVSVIDYFRTIRGDSPNLYWRMTDLDPTTEALGTTAENLTRTGANANNAGGLLLSPDNNNAINISSNATATYFSAPNHALLGNPPFSQISIEAWVNPQALPTTNNTGVVLVHRNGQYDLMIMKRAGVVVAEGWIMDETGSNALIASSSVPISSGQTYHLAMTFDGKTVRIYVNGVLRGSGTDPDGRPVGQISDQPFRVGGDGSPPDTFVGLIDEVALYGYKLSDAQILQHYNTGKNIS